VVWKLPSGSRFLLAGVRPNPGRLAAAIPNLNETSGIMKKKQSPGGLPEPRLPYFNLPDDLPTVVTLARMAAIECAYQRIQGGKQEHANGPRIMAIASCLFIEQRVLLGKQGENDPLKYREAYIDAFVARYPAAREELLSGQIVIDPAWTEPERQAKIYLREAIAAGFLKEN